MAASRQSSLVLHPVVPVATSVLAWGRADYGQLGLVSSAGCPLVVEEDTEMAAADLSLADDTVGNGAADCVVLPVRV